MSRRVQLLSRGRGSSGFTLVELIVAMLMDRRQYSSHKRLAEPRERPSTRLNVIAISRRDLCPKRATACRKFVTSRRRPYRDELIVRRILAAKAGSFSRQATTSRTS